MAIAFRLAPVVLIVAPFVHGFQQTADSVESESEKDVYAIYSLVLTNPRTSHGPDNNERYLIASTTTLNYPPEKCVRPPKEREAEFGEVLADYERRKSTPREIKPAFSITKPYLLLNAKEAGEFQNERIVHPPGTVKPAPDARFQGVTDLFEVSDVYFNRGRTLALTAVSLWCGGLCWISQWKVY